MSMSQRPQFVYLYDGTFPGFLTCVFESYARDEEPACFSLFDDPRTALWPERAVETAILEAQRPAVVLLAGKGCETAQKRKNGPEPCIPDGQLAQRALDKYDAG